MKKQEGASFILTAIFVFILVIFLCAAFFSLAFFFASQNAEAEDIPEPIKTYCAKAGEMFDVPLRLLAGIYAGEHNMGFPISGPWGGAPYLGPLQFDSASWERWGFDGNSNGDKDVNDPCDAIFGLANRCKNSWKINTKSSDYDIIMAILAHRGYAARALLPKDTDRRNYSANLKKYVFGATIGDDVTLRVVGFVFSEGAISGSVVAIAAQEIGVNEADGSYSKYGQSGPWCAAFVCWVYKKAGKEIPGGSHYVPTLYAQVKRVEIPVPGDIIFFGGLSHVGIVERVEPGRIITIEGNSLDMVKRNTYSINSYYIYSYGRFP